MDFVMQWLWYLLAFLAGSAAAWAIAAVRRRGVDTRPQRPREAGTG
jgi:uncharacterized membrane protein ArfB